MGKRGREPQDLTGNRYGMLTAARLVGVVKGGTKWLLRCDCGKTVVRLASNFKKKQHRHSCGCVSNNPGKKDAGFRRLFHDYRASATNRGYSFKLSKKQFKILISSKCHYCEAEPSPRYKKQTVHTLLANGIDRVDNSKGYCKDNCVSCCPTCNRAKGEMSEKEFLDWIRKVHYHSVVE